MSPELSGPDLFENPLWQAVPDGLVLVDGRGTILGTNRRLTGLAASLRDAGEVYRRWADRPAGLTEQQHVDNHRRISDLVGERDAEAAGAGPMRRIELTTKWILGAHPQTH